MAELDDLLANAPPELIRALLEHGLTGPENALQELRYKAATKDAATEQPGLIHARNMVFAQSPLAHLGALFQNIKGQQQQETALQQMQANLLRRIPAVQGLISYGAQRPKPAAAPVQVPAEWPE